MGAPPLHGRVRLDAIRAQLKELGYLQGPLSNLEGLMLAGRGGPSSFLRLNAMASLRVALIGGPLLGIPAAATVAISNRPHITAPRDLLLLCVYLSAALGGALGGLEFLGDTVIAWLTRRGLVLVGRAEKLAARVGLLFFVATTFYLACLVRGGRAALLSPDGGRGGEGAIAWLLWVAAVVGALAIGHLIGRLARIGSLVTLVAAAGGGGLTGRLGLPARRRWLLAAGVASLLVAAGLLVFVPPHPDDLSLRGPTSFERLPLRGRIALIGVDGLDADWYDRMRSRGACPALGRLEAEGARYDLRADAPRVPPAVWTTIATGRPSSEHGILGYRAERVFGLAVPVQENPAAVPISLSLRLLLPPLRPAASPVSSGFRRARSVWEILSQGGVLTAVVNWWATWPAGAADGIVVSERAFPRFLAGRTPEHDVAPDSLQSDLSSSFRSDLGEVQKELSPLGRGGSGRSGELVQTSAVIDGYHGMVARRLFGSGLAQVVLLYLPGLDIARSLSVEKPAEIDVLTPVLSNIDRIVDQFSDLTGPDDLIILVGDPGRGALDGGAGLVLVWGGRVVPGRRTRVVTYLDLAPTLLALAGFPMARDLSGSPAVDLRQVGDVGNRPPDSIESYGWRPEPIPGPTADPLDRELLDRLRSLGYIQ